MSCRVLIYVQHLLGIGHLARTARIARAAVKAGHTVRVLSGGEPVPAISFAGADLIQLPPVRAADAAFSGLVDGQGLPLDAAAKQARAKHVLNAAIGFAPDIIVLEMFPFGRRQMRFELIPLLDHFSGKVPVAVSIRDVLAASVKPEKLRYMVEILDRYRMAVLVHGDPALIPFGVTFPAAEHLGDRLHYTGYVGPEALRSGPERRSTGEVLVSAGGGAVGGPLFQAALAAKSPSEAKDKPWRLVTGANCPPDVLGYLKEHAGLGIVIDAFRSDFQALLAGADVSISQGGYNTVVEGLCLGARMVLVPFAEEGESEQGVRVAELAKRGWVEAVQPDVGGRRIDPPSLANAVDRALSKPRPDPDSLKMDGAAETAKLLGALA